MSGLPEGWLFSRLPDAFELNPSRPGAKALNDDELVSFVPMAAVDADRGEITRATDRPFAKVRKGYTAFRNDDVILAKITPCFENGKAAIARALTNGLGFGSSEFHVMRPNGAVLPEYLLRFIRQPRFRNQAAETMSGTAGQERLRVDYLERFELPIPPIAEQHRIIKSLEALLSELDSAREHLAKIPAILKSFRQSVLAAACSGRLTQDWRDESGAAGSVEEAWRTSDVDSVCESIVDCPHSTPKWTESGDVCLRTTNFSLRGLDLSEVRFVSRQTYERRTARLEPRADDVVYSREGGILGIACVIPTGLRACLGQRMMLMRYDPSVIRSRFLCYVLNSPRTLTVVRELTGGTASPHLNVGDIRKFIVPLPSLVEQDQILDRAAALLALSDAIERRVAGAISRADQLTQSILAKAFRGELVPTEAELARHEGRSYEPASALLDCIRAEERERESPQRIHRRRKSK